ncbi:MAG: hypothetical protein RBS56_05030 [Candidatus Gracilibacteria bacterium]|jgi:hypothetical protein|nr:hypothetical protein [Candidatus Gracilibacteria bacterium]
MKNIKNHIIGFLLIIIGFSAVYIPYRVFAQDSVDKTYESPDFPYALVKSSYHEAMNDLFNEKLFKLSEILEKENFYEDKNFNVPEGANMDNYKEKCGDENVSTYCVSMEGLDIYMTYLNTLAQMKSKVPAREQEEDELDLNSVYFAINSRNLEITNEIENARKVFMSTLSAYNEYRIAYPVHIKNQEIIKSLTKYRKALSSLRKIVDMLPSKFIDATSAYCK